MEYFVSLSDMEKLKSKNLLNKHATSRLGPNLKAPGLRPRRAPAVATRVAPLQFGHFST